MNGMTQNADTKLVITLEHFLSLHEADEIYNMIFDEDTDLNELEMALYKFTGFSGFEDEEN